ncbi:MAG: FtsX-like permease family protein [Bacilli bacterium]|jgi:putative ABC transport system permease protein|nr:FtsX-like permease family protein [Bacilli bacterium]
MKNILIRAFKYLKYKKIKSIMLIILFLIMATTIIFSGIIKATITSYLSSIDNKNGIAISIVAKNRTQGFRVMESSNNLSNEQLTKIKELDYLSDIVINSDITLDSTSITALSTNDSTEDISNEKRMIPNDFSQIRIQVSSNLSLNESLNNLNLLSGKMPSKENDIMISNELATANNLKIGSTFSITSNSIKKDVNISGIYEFTSEQTDFQVRSLPQNTLYGLLSLTTTFKDTTHLNYQYYLKKIDDYEMFKKDYLSITNQTNDNMQFNINDTLYQQTIIPLQQIASGLKIISNITIMVTCAIISIILVITIKERNYEIGVLYALSAQKKSIVIQFCLEHIILIGIAFISAIIINITMASSFINMMLNNKIFSNINMNAQMMQGRGMMNNANIKQTITNIDTIISPSILISNLLFLLFLSTLMILIITIIILRKNPRDIINE